MAIEKKVVKSPFVLIFNIISLMQQWMILLPDEEQELVAMAVRRIKKAMKERNGKSG
jgi:hypothetical protein